jgi:hypothetical protein
MAAVTENRTVTATEAKAAILRCFDKKRPLFFYFYRSAKFGKKMTLVLSRITPPDFII